jgi:hypothetical protein
MLSKLPGLHSLHAADLLTPPVNRRLRYLDQEADVGDGLALGDQLLAGPMLRLSL